MDQVSGGVLAVSAHALADVPGAVQESWTGSEVAFSKFLETYTEACIVLAVALGVAVTFNGRLLLGLVIFAVGALPGGYLSFVIALTALEGYKYAWIVSLIASVVGALLCGWMCFSLLYDLCVFLLGAGFGAIISCFLTAYFLWKIDPKNADVVFYFTSAFLGALFGLLQLSYREFMIPVSTSFVGAWVTVRGISYFVGHFPLPATSGSEPWRSIYIASVMILGTLGAVSQLRGKVPANKAEESTPLNRYEYDDMGSYEATRSQKPNHLRGKYLQTPRNDLKEDDEV